MYNMAPSSQLHGGHQFLAYSVMNLHEHRYMCTTLLSSDKIVTIILLLCTFNFSRIFEVTKVCNIGRVKCTCSLDLMLVGHCGSGLHAKG